MLWARWRDTPARGRGGYPREGRVVPGAVVPWHHPSRWVCNTSQESDSKQDTQQPTSRAVAQAAPKATHPLYHHRA